MVYAKSNESVISKKESTTFAIVSYRAPSFTEIERFCALSGYKLSQTESALRSLSKKGVIVTHRHHQRKRHGLYIPISYPLTEASSKLFKKNYIVLMDFLASQIVFKCALRGSSEIMSGFVEQRAC